MHCRCLGRDEEAVGELPVGEPVGDKRCDLALTRSQLTVGARRRTLQPSGEALGAVLANTRPPREVVIDRPSRSNQRAWAIAGRQQRLGQRRAQGADHRLGEARVGVGQHCAARRPRRFRDGPRPPPASPRCERGCRARTGDRRASRRASGGESRSGAMPSVSRSSTVTIATLSVLAESSGVGSASRPSNRRWPASRSPRPAARAMSKRWYR